MGAYLTSSEINVTVVFVPPFINLYKYLTVV